MLLRYKLFEKVSSEPLLSLNSGLFMNLV